MIRKLLYVSDDGMPDFAQIEGFLALQRLGLGEVVFLLPGKAEDWERRFADRAIRCRTRVEETFSVNGILNTAHEEEVSLIAVNLKKGAGRHSRRSLIRSLIRPCPTPLILMPKGAAVTRSKEAGIFDHVIFPTDWSPVSEKAMAFLLDFKKITGELEIVAVISRKLSVRDMRNLKKRLEETRKIFLDEGIDAEAHVYAGKPSEEIMLASRDYSATSIIMGTSGRSSLKDIFCPSCSYSVAEQAAVPVLVVPSPEGGK
jgi:nucleotide-binding universal stress UspA family protein